MPFLRKKGPALPRNPQKAEAEMCRGLGNASALLGRFWVSAATQLASVPHPGPIQCLRDVRVKLRLLACDRVFFGFRFSVIKSGFKKGFKLKV